MRKLNFIPLAAAGFFLTLPAFASTGAFCLSFAALKMNAQSCDDNFAIGKKADSCLSLYTNEINTGRAQVDAILKSEAAKRVDAQTTSYGNANSVVDRTVSELDRLISNGEAARIAVLTYGQNLSLPEDYDQPQTTGMTTEKYLAVEPCYATPKRIIDENSAVLELMVDDLKSAKKELLAKSGIQTKSSSDLRSATSPGTYSGAKVPVAPSVPKGTPKDRDSDVTGLKDEPKR